jgi:hypothetical protein
MLPLRPVGSMYVNSCTSVVCKLRYLHLAIVTFINLDNSKWLGKLLQTTYDSIIYRQHVSMMEL